MGLFIILFLSEILMFVVLRQHYYNISKEKYSISIVINVIFSLWLWVFYSETISYNSFYDNPRHVWLMTNMGAIISGIVVPRVVIILMHFSGKLIKIKSGGHIRWLTNTGLVSMIAVLTILTLGTLHGRFNFNTEEISVSINGLNKDLEGLKIVQISDMHLNTFFHHKKQLKKVMDEVNRLKPDLLLNTGDFVSFGWREYERDDTILSIAKSRYGNFAILGNHDVGTYDPYFTEADRRNNISIMNNLIKASGYQVLNDEHKIVTIAKARVAVIGVVTGGRFPNMTHGNLEKATSGLDSSDLKILLSHDPNHWTEAVLEKTNIELTLSGHTHGMQMGIITKKFRWSPSKYFYPHWNGLYKEGTQYQYVNRGLGVLSIPFRIWMPPEITVITLKKE